MSAQLKANESDLPQPILSEVQAESNGKQTYTMPGQRREPPALRQDNLTDAMAVLVQSMAEEREERREQRAITQALIAKLANGNGTSKVKTIIQTVVAVIGVVLIIGAYVVSISSDRAVQQMKVQALEEKAAKAEKLEQDVRKLEKLYMVRFGVDPSDDNTQKPDNKRR